MQSSDMTEPSCLLPMEQPVRAALVAVGRHDPTDHGRYFLPDLWCLHLYEWHGSVDIEDQRVMVRPGALHIVSPGKRLRYQYAERSRHFVAHFDVAEGGASRSLPSIVYQHPSLVLVRDLFARAADLGAGHRHTDALLWAILWELTVQGMPDRVRDPRVLRVCQHVRRHLQEDLNVGKLAASVDLSHNQLTRLFRKELGSTVMSYIRAQRIARGKHLLTHSDMPVRDVAAEVGIDDPNRFNKVFRQLTGVSPTGFRARCSKRRGDESTVRSSQRVREEPQ